jgi:hypothetical protein
MERTLKKTTVVHEPLPEESVGGRFVGEKYLGIG